MTHYGQGHIGHCDTHHKLLYTSRDQAKAAARQIPQRNGSHMRPYRCDHVAGMWHLGHLAKEVVKGRRTADQVYPMYRKGPT